MLNNNKIFGKNDIFFENIGRNFKNKRQILVPKNNIMFQILSRSDALKKKVVYQTHKKIYLSFCLKK